MQSFCGTLQVINFTKGMNKNYSEIKPCFAKSSLLESFHFSVPSVSLLKYLTMDELSLIVRNSFSRSEIALYSHTNTQSMLL